MSSEQLVSASRSAQELAALRRRITAGSTRLPNLRSPVLLAAHDTCRTKQGHRAFAPCLPLAPFLPSRSLPHPHQHRDTSPWALYRLPSLVCGAVRIQVPRTPGQTERSSKVLLRHVSQGELSSCPVLSFRAAGAPGTLAELGMALLRATLQEQAAGAGQ